MSIVPVLEFVSVAVFGPPAFPTATLDQLMEDGETVAEVAVVELPVPDKPTDRVPEPSLTVQVAERAPEADGLNTRFIVQLAEAARVDPQVVEEMAKSPEFVPEIAAPLRVTELDVLLVSEIDCAPLVPPTLMPPKVKLDGVAVTVPEEETPRPDSATSCGLPPALSVKAKAAVRFPPAVGLKRTVTAQLAEAAMVVPQVSWYMEKSEAFVPVIAMLLMLMVLLPVFVKVVDFGPPALPTLTLAQLIDEGERLAVEAEVDAPELESVPWPESAICCGLLPELSAKFKLAVLVPVAVGLNSTVTVQLAEGARDDPQVLL